MPQLEFEFFWHQYFWVSIVFVVSLYILSENFLLSVVAIKSLRSLKLEFLEQENDFTVDPVSESFIFDTVFTPIFYTNGAITKDFYRLFIKSPAIEDLHSSVYSFKFYRLNYTFRRYIYNTHEEFNPIYYFYLEEQTKISLLVLNNKLYLS